MPKNPEYYRFCPTCNTQLFYSCSQSKANSNKVNAECRKCATKKYINRDSNLENLLNKDYIFYYWLGFILADGHIGDNNRLVVTLADVDLEHLTKLANYLNTTVHSVNKPNRRHSCIRVMNVEIFTKIKSEFDIKSNKTKNPPNTDIFKKLTDDELLCVFVGFTDGDGNIGNLSKRQDFHLRIKCHSTWFDILWYFNSKLNLLGNCKINNQGYSVLCISNTFELKRLKKRVELLNIPILKRKWDKIDFNYIGRNEIANERKQQVHSLLQQTKTVNEISDILNLKPATIRAIIKRNNF